MFNKFTLIILLFATDFLFLSCSSGTDSNNPLNKQWIAYPEVFEYGNNVHYKMRLFDSNGQDIHTIFDEHSFCFKIEWMKDKPEIIYSGLGSSFPTFLKLYNLDKSQEIVLWKNDSTSIESVNIADIAISNQNKIAFALRYNNGPGHLCTINRDGSNFIKFNGITGLHLTYIDTKIFVVNDDGTGLKKVTPDSLERIFDYCISPDGKNIIYMYWNGPGGNILYQSDINGDGHKPIFYLDSAALSQTGYEYINHPTFSPDGKKILFSQKSSVLTILNFETYEFKQIDVDIIGKIRNPAWIANGEKIVFSTNENGMFNLCLINPDGTGYKKVISVENQWSTFKASPLY